MVNCKKRQIPINIRNTNNPSAPGTMIVAERVPEETVVGIARRDNIAYLYLEKDGAGETVGFVSSLLKIMKDFGIETYHYPTDKDDISVIFNQSDLKGFENVLEDAIKEKLHPNKLEFNYNITFLSPVGIGMKNCPGIIATASTALKEKNVNIEIIDQGPSQYSFHFGIQNCHADTALKALYEALCKK
jgi:aspartate kinase